jgi:hypothetical protein
VRYEVELVREGRVIYTTHHGVVDAEEIVAAIEDERALALAHPSVRFVVFDYTDATMAAVDAEGNRRCAEAGARLLAACPRLVLLGVVPKALDYGLSRMFRARVDLGPEEVSAERVDLLRDPAELDARIEAAFEKGRVAP